MLSSSRLTSCALNAMKNFAMRSTATSAADTSKYNYQTLSVKQPSDFVLHIELNRPEKLNAMNNEMWSEIISCFNNAAKDRDVRAIVLSGNGKAFTAGLDLMAAVGDLSTNAEMDVARNAFKFLDHIRFAQESCSVVERCMKPVVAAIHSACIGGGVDLITACDMRLCTKDAYFCVKEVDVGLAADLGTLQRLPKVIGNDSLARELCFTARKLEAEEAKEIGLVSRLYENKETLIDGAIELASLIASKSPVAVQGTKHHLNYARDHSTQDSLDYMVPWNAAMLQSEDIRKSAEAFMMKKKPSDVVYSKL